MRNYLEAFTRVAMYWRADRQGVGFDLVGEIELGKRAFGNWARNPLPRRE